MEWLDRHVSPAQVSLKKRPEIFQPIRVDLPIDIPLCMVNELMHVPPVECIVGDCAIRVDFGAIPNLLENFVLESFTLHVGNNLRANFSGSTVEYSHHCGLAEVHISTPLLTANLLQFQL